MNSLLACRVCLAYDTRLCSIMDGQIRNVYETLVKASLETEDMLPTTVCYICFSLMKKILQFRDRSLKANQILQQMNSLGLKPSVSSLDMLIKDQTGISWTLGISTIEKTTTTSGEVELKVEIESVKSEMDIDGMSDRNEDYSDSMPVYRDSTSDSEDDLPVQNIREQCEMDRVKIEEISNVTLKKSIGHEGAAPPEKRKLDENESENDSVYIQASLRNTVKDEEPREQKEDKKKIPVLKKRGQYLRYPLKTILKETEMTTSNIISENDSAFNKNYTVTAPKDTFTCDVCKNEYQSKTVLETHIKKSHLIELNRNANSIHSQLKVTNECKSTKELEGQEIPSNDNLTETNKGRTDIKNRNKEKLYQCSYCTKRFTRNSNLTYHLNIHTKRNLYKCDICERGFSKSENLTRHYRVHTKEKPFKCDICEKYFTQSNNLTKHLRIHSGEKPYSCFYCKKRFSENGQLHVHLRVHTKEKPFECDICKKCFSHRTTFINHKRIHSGEKPYSCSYCNKRFSQIGILHKHLRVHNTEVTPFKCDICKKYFSGSSSLTIHLRIHSGEKPYSCSNCNKRFCRHGDLTKHLRVHTKEKPYKCDLCEKCFSRKETLTTHLRVHTKVKPFKCDICEKYFTQNSNLTRHLRLHTRENPF